MRKLVQAHVDARGAGHTLGEVRGADGVVREPVRLHECRLQTIFGAVRVSRVGYAAPGEAAALGESADWRGARDCPSRKEYVAFMRR